MIQLTERDGGVTFDIRTSSVLNPSDVWFYPKYPECTAIVEKSLVTNALYDFVAQEHERFHEDGCYLGLWRNPHTDTFYIDITTRSASKEYAVDEARRISIERGRKIVSIYNPVRNQTVYIWDEVRA